jgi:hypothetical protein
MGACGVGVYVKVYDGGMVGRIQLTSVALVVCVHDRGAPVHTATVARALAAACEQGRTGAREGAFLTHTICTRLQRYTYLPRRVTVPSRAPIFQYSTGK